MSPTDANPMPAPRPIFAPVDMPSELGVLVALLDELEVDVVVAAVPVPVPVVLVPALVPVVVPVAVAIVLLLAAEACAKNAASPTVMITPVPAQLFSRVAYTVCRSLGLALATHEAVLYMKFPPLVQRHWFISVPVSPSHPLESADDVRQSCEPDG